MAEALLEVRQLSRRFGALDVLQGVDFSVEAGEVHALIGPNGAGKTTVFNLLTKFLPPTAGTILFEGRDITREAPAVTARRGMVRSFQISATFPHLTVLENVRIALPAALLTLVVLVLARGRSRRQEDARHVNLFILLLILVACLLLYYRG
mgnify:CR=1 FL=1